MVRVAAVLALLIALSSSLAAQENRNTGFLVHQLLVCPNSNMEDINRLNALNKPILDELVAEGMIRAWYDLRHAWGDEWNVGIITVADSHRAWLDYWSEYLRRFNERHPNLLAESQRLCTMHKDNMYSIRDSGVS